MVVAAVIYFLNQVVPSLMITLAIALFASLIIRLFQLVFLAGTVFFSHNKLAGTVFRLVFSAKRTGPKNHPLTCIGPVRFAEKTLKHCSG